MPEDARPDLRQLFSLVLARPRAEREAAAREMCGGDPHLLQQLLDILNADAELDALGIDPPSALNDLSGTRLGAYVLVRELGRGGMGTVYLARRADGAFDRHVAIKVIGAARAAPDLIARFELERRLAASLDHPNIVRLLDAGNEDGRLYFVMEYVDGLPLHQYAEERRLTLRQRLALFRIVCDTVAYAHRNLIVHRDLKPGNILVDNSGAPKLLDFGLAKPITAAGLESDDPTDPLQKRMTVAYASPEHRAGLPTHISMDVYSLGVVLHKLLIGRLPQPLGEHEEAVSGVGPYPKPSYAARRAGLPHVARALEGDVEAIIMRALAPNRRDRYESVDSLSADVQRYLEHRPVMARARSRGDVMRKFVRRHRLPVAVAAAFVIVAAAAVGALYTSYRQARDERVRADRRFAQVRTLAQALFSIDGELAAVPGSTAARRRLVESASGYLDALRPEAGNYPWLALEVAQGYRRLGDVQGNPNVANLGDLAAAAISYDSALALLRDLESRAVSDDVRVALAQTYSSRGDLLWAQGDAAEATTLYEQALAIAEELKRRSLADVRYQELISGLHRPMGDIRLAQNDVAKAVEHYRAAVTIDSALHAAAPDRREYRRLLALSEIRMAAAATVQGDPSAARDALARARALLEALVAAGVRSPAIQRELAVGDARLGTLLTQLGDRAGTTHLHRAVDTFRQLAAADPADVRLRRDLASALVQQGDAVGGDSPARAQALYAEARQLALRLPSGDPEATRIGAAVDARLSLAGGTPSVPRLQVMVVADGKRVPLQPGQPPLQNTDLVVAPAGPRRGVRYLVVFGASGPAELLSEEQMIGGGWTVKAAGPPPAQTVMLVDAHRALSAAEQATIVDAVAAVPDDRIADFDSVVSWTAGGELEVQSRASARGRLPWIDAVRARLARVPGIVILARTFPLRPSPDR